MKWPFSSCTDKSISLGDLHLAHTIFEKYPVLFFGSKRVFTWYWGFCSGQLLSRYKLVRVLLDDLVVEWQLATLQRDLRCSDPAKRD